MSPPEEARKSSWNINVNRYGMDSLNSTWKAASTTWKMPYWKKAGGID
jgi:hypothetical protein